MLSRVDLVIGTIIAACMATVFTLLSPGSALIATFVPGVLWSWLLFVFLYRRGHELPPRDEVLPVYLVTLSWQFLHFYEEFTTGFHKKFGVAYDGPPADDNPFLLVNMASYALFLLAAVIVFYAKKRFLLVPMLFFIVYGAVGNAFNHTLWTVVHGGYFPGQWTSLAYWVLGPLCLVRLGFDKKEAALALGGWVAVMAASAALFLDAPALRGLAH